MERLGDSCFCASCIHKSNEDDFGGFLERYQAWAGKCGDLVFFAQDWGWFR